MQQAHDYLAEVDELSNLLRDQLESIFFKKSKKIQNLFLKIQYFGPFRNANLLIGDMNSEYINIFSFNLIRYYCIYRSKGRDTTSLAAILATSRRKIIKKVLDQKLFNSFFTFLFSLTSRSYFLRKL